MLNRPLFRSHGAVLVIILGTASLLSSCSSGPVVHRPPGLVNPLSLSRQMIVMITPSWDSLTGTLTAYERDDERGEWRLVDSPIGMTLGSSGLGWGTGLHGWALSDGPVKKEGDKRSPAGVFDLPAIYGYAPAEDVRSFSMPYIPLDSMTFCVDDPSSTYYNMIVDRRNVRTVDWTSAERMKLRGPWYRWGVVVGHNLNPRIPGDGSCIFIHVWGNSTEPTTGCSSIDEGELLKLLTWLKPNAHPVLVQLPQGEYARLRVAWQLP